MSDADDAPGIVTASIEDARHRLRQLQAVFAASPPRCLALLGLFGMNFLAAGASMVAIGVIVRAVSSHAPPSALITGIVLLGIALMLVPIIEAVVAVLSVTLDQRVRTLRADQLARVLLAPDSLHHLDSGGDAEEAAELVEQSRSWQILSSTENVVGVVQTRITALAPFVLLCTWHWWVAVLVALAFAMLSHACSGYLDRLVDSLHGTSTTQRLHRYMFRLAGGTPSAKEVRLFGLLPWLSPQLATFHRGDRMQLGHLRGLRAVEGLSVLTAFVVLGSVLLLVADAMAGRIDPGQVAVFATAIAAMMSWGPLGDVQILYPRAGRHRRRLDALERRLGTLPDPSATRLPAARSGGGNDGSITVRDLSFRYPGRDQDTLQGLDLHIPPGQSVGVVGVNGAGKSTLMSLIAGLESPTSGSVRIGDRPAQAPEEGRPDVAVILQSFSRYPLDVRDNILLGRPGADAAVTDHIRRAGGTDVLEQLEQRHGGLDTVLAAGYSGGTDLSGGQWQRLAIARALAAVDAGAGVLVLDEPTSALDVRAEAALFEDFMQVTRGVTTLLVSHRLSSVRHVDRIVVLDGGRIIEDGSHDELIARGGAYADMFAVQARRFAQTGTHHA